MQRDDDKPECIRNRLASYDEVSLLCTFNDAVFVDNVLSSSDQSLS